MVWSFTGEVPAFSFWALVNPEVDSSCLPAMLSCRFCLSLCGKGQLVAIRALIWEAQVFDMLLKLLKGNPHRKTLLITTKPLTEARGSEARQGLSPEQMPHV